MDFSLSPQYLVNQPNTAWNVVQVFRKEIRPFLDTVAHYLETAGFDGERILAKVQDRGPGFDPDQVADPLREENLERPSGRGLLLMRSSMDRIEFNPRGNCVTLIKFRFSSHHLSERKSCHEIGTSPWIHAG